MSFLSAHRIATAAGCLFVACAHGGGSGLNVAVVVNQGSSNSVALGNYYCEKRAVPPNNLVRIQWNGGNVQWTLAELNRVLYNPLVAALQARGLTDQVDTVVLSMDIPYRVTQAGGLGTAGVNSTTAALFYGFKADTAATPNSCSLPPDSDNSYAASEQPFELAPPDTATGLPFLAMMITHSNLAEAKRIIDRGVTSDATHPTNTVLLSKSSDKARNIRYQAFDNAILNATLLGAPSIIRNNSSSPYGQSGLLGYQNGLYQFNILSNTFVPGVMADTLTSYGGVILAPNDHTTLLRFLWAGATASYGTVVEPCAYLEKFPDPQDYFYQGRGFNVAESYYMSLLNPYQGLLVGEPLATPFAQPSAGAWENLTGNVRLTGTTNLVLNVVAADADRPVDQVDLFVDGTFFSTLMAVPPTEGNRLQVVIDGRTMTYTVPSGATLGSVAAGLHNELNKFSNRNATDVDPFLYGDRIELRSHRIGRAGNDVPTSATSSINSAPQLTTFVRASRTTFLDTSAFGIRSYRFQQTPDINETLQVSVTKTNGANVVVSVTNSTGLSIGELVYELANAINANPDLNGPDGLIAEDFLDYAPSTTSDLNLRARSAGWDAARIQVAVTTSSPVTVDPSGTQRLDENLTDLQPRNHLYVTAGRTNLPVSFAFDTTQFADGYHQLSAVVYEGSHVRTQKRVLVDILISNSPLAATFTTLVGGSNTAIEATLEFRITANTASVTSMELFSTGGLVASTNGVSATTLSVPASNLGLGLHPFYTIVTTPTDEYRTETKYCRVIGEEPPFPLIISAPPAALAWEATAGRDYVVSSGSSVTGPYAPRQTVTPTNTLGSWNETNSEPVQFYRVETSP